MRYESDNSDENCAMRIIRGSDNFYLSNFQFICLSLSILGFEVINMFHISKDTSYFHILFKELCSEDLK